MPLSARCIIAFIVSAVLAAGANVYHLDCGSGNDQASGTSPSEAWRTLAKANAVDLKPGDRLVLKRAAVCKGVLSPRGSGSSSAPISIGAYGDGPPPIIDAGGAEAAVRLFNQSYWRITSIHATGSSVYGIFVSGDSGTMPQIRLTDVLVSNVKGALKNKNSGLIVFVPKGQAIFEDVVIDGATVWDTNQWAGILVNGAPFSTPLAERRSRRIVIRNSVAHDVWGDGIVLYQVEDGLIERSVAWNTGLQPTQTIGTPNGIWTWRCADCVVRESESFFADSPGVDGGAFDIDWGNDRNILETSYGHDTQAYCFSIFGAGKMTTTASVIRNNTCAGNGRSPRLALNHGAVHLTTWDGGTLDGVDIHDNLILWEPPIDAPVVKNDSAFQGGAANLFRNNRVWSAVPLMSNTNDSLKFEGNRYWLVRGTPKWRYGGSLFTGFEQWQAGGNDASGKLEPFSLRPDVKAKTPAPASVLKLLGAASRGGEWSLASVLDLDSADGRAAARSQAVILRSAALQYRSKGLRVAALALGSLEAIEMARLDWKLAGVEMIRVAEAGSLRPSTYLISPDGSAARQWDGYAPAKDVIYPIRWILGAPLGVAAEPGR